MTTLAGVGRRVKNDKRAHLLVSSVTAKYVPVAASQISSIASALASMVHQRCPDSIQVITYAEAGIGIGAELAWHLGAPLISSTRTRRPQVWCEFSEPHSHASYHAIARKPEAIEDVAAIVLVDDEMTSGVTVMNTIAALRATGDVTTKRFVIATLVDARSEADRTALEAFAEHSGLDIEVVALETFTGSTTPTSAKTRPAGALEGGYVPVLLDETITVPSLANGWSPWDMSEIDAELGVLAWRLHIDVTKPTLVLGTEEFLWPAVRLARAIDADVSSTTASPAVVDDESDGYPIRSGFSFQTPNGVRYAYNTDGYEQIVVVTDDVRTAPPTLATKRAWCVVTEVE